MAYAVFDWDNTIRKGFTLFSWMDFLYEKEILNMSIRRDIFSVQDQYAKKRINHDEYAKRSCEIYSSAMQGVSKKTLCKLVNSYIQYDKQSLMPFSRTLFEYMNVYNIRPVIISGAPQYILEKYKDVFKLDNIYAFSEEYVEGLCTGKVAYNYGMNKGKTIQRLCKAFGMKPLAGFGDSDSDIPLFKMSDYAFCIVKANSKNDMSYGKDVTYISDDTNESQIEVILQDILGQRKL